MTKSKAAEQDERLAKLLKCVQVLTAYLLSERQGRTSGTEEAEVTAKSKFVDDLDADSLDTVELVMAFEEKFDINISDEDAEKIVTVQDAVDYLDRAKVTI